MTDYWSVKMRLRCFASQLTILISTLFQTICCPPSDVIINSGIHPTSRRPNHYAHHSVTTTTSSTPRYITMVMTGRPLGQPAGGWMMKTEGVELTTSASQSRHVQRGHKIIHPPGHKSRLQDLNVTPAGNSRHGVNITESLDELLLRVKRRGARGGGFGNTGRHGPRERLDYNSSPRNSFNFINQLLLLLASSIFTGFCLII